MSMATASTLAREALRLRQKSFQASAPLPGPTKTTAPVSVRRARRQAQQIHHNREGFVSFACGDFVDGNVLEVFEPRLGKVSAQPALLDVLHQPITHA